jgi:hypothetical protein
VRSVESAQRSNRLGLTAEGVGSRQGTKVEDVRGDLRRGRSCSKQIKQSSEGIQSKTRVGARQANNTVPRSMHSQHKARMVLGRYNLWLTAVLLATVARAWDYPPLTDTRKCSYRWRGDKTSKSAISSDSCTNPCRTNPLYTLSLPLHVVCSKPRLTYHNWTEAGRDLH